MFVYVHCSSLHVYIIYYIPVLADHTERGNEIRVCLWGSVQVKILTFICYNTEKQRFSNRCRVHSRRHDFLIIFV